MNNKVNDVFLDNDKELLVGDKIVLESDQGITNDEKDILESIFDKIKENNLENGGSNHGNTKTKACGRYTGICRRCRQRL